MRLIDANMADREPTEKLILDKLEEIKQIILEYNPDETYLAMIFRRGKTGTGMKMVIGRRSGTGADTNRMTGRGKWSWRET